MSRFFAGMMLAALALPGLTGCATVSANEAHPEARAYDASSAPSADIDAALVRTELSGKNLLVVMGGNWCHDSRAFAGWMETPRFAAMLAERYEVIYVNVGMPQTGDGHNIDIAHRFGLDEVVGTPTVLIIAPDGTLLNADTAGSWRNTATRREDAIFDELVGFAEPKTYSPS
jgi:thiol-disulfide isomerase/thioredoxin